MKENKFWDGSKYCREVVEYNYIRILNRNARFMIYFGIKTYRQDQHSVSALKSTMYAYSHVQYTFICDQVLHQD